jgi:glycosyltransferase involved in cell wall biosynthesis
MTNITMLVHDRSVLTYQALSSLRMSGIGYKLTIIDDASGDETKTLLKHEEPFYFPYYLHIVRNEQTNGTGNARNQSVLESERAFGRGDYLYLTDNDCYFLPLWLDNLIEAYEHAHKLGFRVLGAYNHPYNAQAIRSYPTRLTRDSRQFELRENHALGGMMSYLMTWATWDEFGPFVSTPPGAVRQSEDFEFCQRIRSVGYKVGCIYPHLVINTGRTDSFGQQAVGAECVPDVEGVIVE